jgi:hypothetical protein
MQLIILRACCGQASSGPLWTNIHGCAWSGELNDTTEKWGAHGDGPRADIDIVRNMVLLQWKARPTTDPCNTILCTVGTIFRYDVRSEVTHPTPPPVPGEAKNDTRGDFREPAPVGSI